MKILIGLGNPGRRYQGTRHNVGFEVADKLVQRLRTSYSSGYRCVLAHTAVESVDVLIVKPMTYMNRSGEIIPFIDRRWGIRPQDLLVMFDDMSLPIGRIRLRPKGSSGGHNGVRSVIHHLGTDAFPRLRIGIGAPPATSRGGAADYVLSQFTRQERTVVEEVQNLAVDAVLTFISEGVDSAMSLFNPRFVSSDVGRTDRSD